MAETPMRELLLRNKDQYSLAIRTTSIGLSILFLLHLIMVGPFLNLHTQLQATKSEMSNAQELRKDVDHFRKSVDGLRQKQQKRLNDRLDVAVNELKRGFRALSGGVKLMREMLAKLNRREAEKSWAVTLASLDRLRDPPEKEKQGVSSQILGPSNIYPELRPPAWAAPPLSPQQKALMDGVIAAPSIDELLPIVNELVEVTIISPAFARLNRDWTDTLLPDFDDAITGIIGLASKSKARHAERGDDLERLISSLITTKEGLHTLKFAAPLQQYWWRNAEDKELVVRIGLSELVEQQLLRPDALKQLIKDLDAVIATNARLATEMREGIEQLERNFESQSKKLASIAKPLGYLPFDLRSMASSLPLLLGLAIAWCVVWITARLRELGLTSQLMMREAPDSMAWVWYSTQWRWGLLGLQLARGDQPVSDDRVGIIRATALDAALICALSGAWIWIAYWQTYGWPEVDALLTLGNAAVGSLMVGAAVAFRFRTLGRLLSYRPATNRGGDSPQ